MNKTEFVAEVAARTELTVGQAQAAVDAVMEVIGHRTALGEKVVLTGFGTFGSRDVPARMVRNPATGEPMHKGATRKPTFKAGSALRSVVAGEALIPAERR